MILSVIFITWLLQTHYSVQQGRRQTLYFYLSSFQAILRESGKYWTLIRASRFYLLRRNATSESDVELIY